MTTTAPNLHWIRTVHPGGMTSYESGRYLIESSPGVSRRTGERSGRYSGRVELFRDGQRVCGFARVRDAKARAERDATINEEI